jgi:hypothetical protein
MKLYSNAPCQKKWSLVYFDKIYKTKSFLSCVELLDFAVSLKSEIYVDTFQMIS